MESRRWRQIVRGDREAVPLGRLFRHGDREACRHQHSDVFGRSIRRTTLEGHIVGDSDHPGYTVEVPDWWSTEDGGFIVKGWTRRAGAERVGRRRGTSAPVPLEGNGDRAGPDRRRPRRGTHVAATARSYGADRRDPGGSQRSVPDDWVVTGDSDFRGYDEDDEGHEDFMSWWGTEGGTRYQQVAGQVDRLWILDVEGQTLVVDATYSPDTSVADRHQLEQVVESLRFVNV
jgi:hypothetical protein